MVFWGRLLWVKRPGSASPAAACVSLIVTTAPPKAPMPSVLWFVSSALPKSHSRHGLGLAWGTAARGTLVSDEGRDRQVQLSERPPKSHSRPAIELTYCISSPATAPRGSRLWYLCFSSRNSVNPHRDLWRWVQLLPLPVSREVTLLAQSLSGRAGV